MKNNYFYIVHIIYPRPPLHELNIYFVIPTTINDVSVKIY